MPDTNIVTDTWAIVLSSAGNMHLMPYDNIWANDEILKVMHELTRDEAKEEYQAWLREVPKVRAYQDSL